jgi:Methyltransferase domain
MTWMDRWIQKQRINRVIQHVPPGSVVLDIGCSWGELFQAMGSNLGNGFGMDPLLPGNIEKPRYKLFKGFFPDDWNIKTAFHCITLLAVLEHIPAKKQQQTIKNIFNLLIPGGLVVLTIPSKKADRILLILNRLGFIHGMSLEEHYGFDPADTKILFKEAGFALVKYQTFQFGLNNLFVFKKIE